MSEPHWGPWLIAGLRARRKALRRERGKLALKAGVPADVRARGVEALDAIIAEIDTQMRGLEFGWEEGT